MRAPGRANPWSLSWWSLTLCLAGLGVFVAFNLSDDHRQMQFQESNRLQTQARVVAQNLELQLRGLNRGLLDIFRSLPATEETPLPTLLRVYSESTPAISSLVLLDARGNAVGMERAGGGWGGMEERFDLPFARMRPDRLYFSATSGLRGGPAPAIARVFFDGSTRWTAVALLNPRYFEDVLDSVRYRGDIQVRFLVGGAPLFQVPLSAAPDGPLTFERPVLDHGVQTEPALSVRVGANESSFFTTWNTRVVSSSVLFGALGLLSVALLGMLQRRQRRFEDRDSENAERLRLASEAAELGVWEYHIETGTMTWEPSMYRLHGLSPGHFPNSTQAWRTSLLPEDVPRADAFMQEIRNGDETLSTKLRFRTDEGEVRTFRTIAKGFQSADGNCVRVVGIHQDITQSVHDQQQLKQLNLDLKQRTAEAEQANSTKSQFLANMSHEIRTPMNAVLGLLTILGRTSLDGRQREYVKKAEGAGKFLLTLLNDILDISKAEAGKLVLERAPFNLHSLLADTATVLGTMAGGKNVEVIFDTSPHLPQTVIGDSFRLHQILLNLGGNAIKFTDTGSVTVEVHATEAPGGVDLQVAVVDTGIGIAEDKLADIFQGFVQAEASTTRRFGGSGLGLSICRLLIGQMGGSLQVRSELGRGSRFSFSARLELPLSNGLAPVVRKASSPVRIVVVDDNPQVREVLVRMIHSLGWEAEAAATGVEALSLLTEESGLPQVVLLDASLPGWGGEVMAEAMATMKFRNVPKLILSVTLGQEAAEGQGGPWDAQLTKPVTPSALVDVVEGLLVRAARSAPAAPSRRLAGRRVLVVEDHPVNQLVAQELLLGEGAEVVVAPGGREALARLEDGPFDCVLMDLQMPEMDGFEATRRIRARFGEIPFVVAVTANALPADKEACLQAGMDSHLGKPLELEELVETIVRGKRRDT